MKAYENRGAELRDATRELVLDFMKSSLDCRPGGVGLQQAKIFRACGLDWGDKKKAPSTRQQYWLVAVLRQLEEEGLVEQTAASGPWRLLGKKL